MAKETFKSGDQTCIVGQRWCYQSINSLLVEIVGPGERNNKGYWPHVKCLHSSGTLKKAWPIGYIADCTIGGGADWKLLDGQDAP